jgi:hypothetical protein
MHIPFNIEFKTNENLYDFIKLIMIPIILTLLLMLVTMIISNLYIETTERKINNTLLELNELNKKQLLRITGQKHKYKNKNELAEIARNKIKCRTV